MDALPNNPPLRVKLLPLVPLHAHFLVYQPATGCAVCGARFRRGEGYWSCERCGIPMHGECHWETLATPEERRILESEDCDHVIYLCQGCRS